MSAQGTTGSAMGSAQRAGDSDSLENLARVGLIAYGVVHVLVAWLALQLAWGSAAAASRPTSPARWPPSRSLRSASPCCGWSRSG